MTMIKSATILFLRELIFEIIHYYNISHIVKDKDRDSRYYSTVFQFMVGDGRQYVGRYAFTASNDASYIDVIYTTCESL